MSISTDPQNLIAFLLALVRASAWVLVSPPFLSLPTPPILKAGIAASLALLATPTLAVGHIPLSMAAFIGAVAVQVVMGFALGLVTLTLFSAFEAAGAMSDLLGGIVLPPSLDPLSENQTPKVGELYQLVAVALLFASGGDLVVLHGFLFSFHSVGISLSTLGPMSQVLTRDLASFFVAAIEIAAPVLVVLFAAQVVLALLSKAAPQVNVFLLGFPFQALLLLLVIAVSLRLLPSAVQAILSRSVDDGLRALGF
jgi:flagellar biosynthetic protein FliR